MLDVAAHAGLSNTTATEDLDSVVGRLLSGPRTSHLEETNRTVERRIISACVKELAFRGQTQQGSETSAYRSS